MSANVQGILKLVDQLGIAKDSATPGKSLSVSFHSLSSPSPHFEPYSRHDLTETMRATAKRGSEDPKKVSMLQALLVRTTTTPNPSNRTKISALPQPTKRQLSKRPLINFHSSPFGAPNKSAPNANAPSSKALSSQSETTATITELLPPRTFPS